MASHFDYAIDSIDTFYEFYLRLQSYGEKSAFLEQQEISYKLLIESINKISQVLKCRNQYVLLNLYSKYYFAAAYFATILSGNTACLQACVPNVDEFYSEFKFAYQLTDAVVASITVRARASEIKGDTALSHKTRAGQEFQHAATFWE